MSVGGREFISVLSILGCISVMDESYLPDGSAWWRPLVCDSLQIPTKAMHAPGQAEMADKCYAPVPLEPPAHSGSGTSTLL